jgi:dienelactone hydrolase
MKLPDIPGSAIATAVFITAAATSVRAEPATVYFPSADGTTRLVGYLFMPTTPGPHPAVVLLHGRGGPYSAPAKKNCTLVAEGTPSDCSAATLSKRHQSWGEYWAAHGYLALLPDSFGPRNKGHGFARFTHDDPDRDDVNERTVRPLDAEGALKYLQTRQDVTPSHIFLQGWSNGGSTTLNVMYRQAQTSSPGFRAALAFYPGCGSRALISQDYKTVAPMTVFLASDDEEVSPIVCHRVLDAAAANGSPLTLVDYAGATHDFDDPGKKRQSVPANATAREDVLKRAAEIFGK